MSELSREAAKYAALGDETRLRIVQALRLGDLAPNELAGRLGIGSNLMTHHLDVLEDAGLVERRVSEGDRRRRYVVLRREELPMGPTDGGLRSRSVLFVCTHNSARSQFAEALARENNLKAQSAGTIPAPVVHPKAIRVAAEQGIDLSALRPKPLDEVLGETDLVISVCDRAGESEFPFGAPRLHWSIPDPVKSGKLADFRAAWAEVSSRLDSLTGELSRNGAT